MAQPTVATFGKFLLLLGDGASPEVFSAPCGFTDRSLELKADTNSTQVPDCDNPDAPAWETKDISTLSVTVTGQGVLALEALPKWRDWYFSATPKNVRVQLALPAGKGPGYYQGAAILTSLKHDSAVGEKIKLSVNIENTGAWSWVAAA